MLEGGHIPTIQPRYIYAHKSGSMSKPTLSSHTPDTQPAPPVQVMPGPGHQLPLHFPLLPSYWREVLPRSCFRRRRRKAAPQSDLEASSSVTTQPLLDRRQAFADEDSEVAEDGQVGALPAALPQSRTGHSCKAHMMPALNRAVSVVGTAGAYDAST